MRRLRIEHLAAPYEEYFSDWFEHHGVDWVCAVNMTLSDAVPVTLALHRAAQRRWSAGRPGGVLFWDHDLYGSYVPFLIAGIPGSIVCGLMIYVLPPLDRRDGPVATFR